jgi:hypothetical protein
LLLKGNPFWRHSCIQSGTFEPPQLSNVLTRPWPEQETIMNSNTIRVLAAGVAVAALAIQAQRGFSRNTNPQKDDVVANAVNKGLKWLISVQGADGGWGQDGGATSYVRQGENLETKGNDVANTAVAATALLHAGHNGEYRAAIERAVDFILRHVEESPAEGLAVTDLNGTQIQRKLGPFIDTFLSSKLLAELDGNMHNARLNARVRQGLEKCVAKIEKNQLKDGSWNVAGGWAPILGTSMASQSLFMAQKKGLAVSNMAMARVEEYTASAGQTASGIGAGVGGGIGDRVSSAEVSVAASAGVPLYQGAQVLEQLSRTDKDRRKNAKQIKAITDRLSDDRFATGFGSMGGEEFFSYLNISDSLHRTGGAEWEKWNGDMKTKLVRLQNDDGTWAGHHCITGRVAVTSAAILTMLAERDSFTMQSGMKKN